MPHAFSALATAAYCPRKLYYARRAGDLSNGPPDDVAAVRGLADRYDELLDADDPTLAGEPIAVPPARFQHNLRRVRAGVERFPDLVDPAGRDVYLDGREAHGVAHKVLADPPVPSLVSAGAPPENGVWEPQTVRAVAETGVDFISTGAITKSVQATDFSMRFVAP